MSDAPSAAPKAKKSVALSGVTAGNAAALCTVGVTGNDLHYRGYITILEIANTCEFEEIAFLLVHGKLPNRAELDGYKAKLKSLRGLSVVVRAALETLPAAAASDGCNLRTSTLIGVGLRASRKGRSAQRLPALRISLTV